MSRNYEQHITNYVLQHFRQFMTDVERAAEEAVVFTVAHEGQEEPHITFRAGTSEDIAKRAERALAEGVQAFRLRTRERILSEHRAEVFANACPKCGRLPATPKAKMCIWCSHSWREASNA